MFELAWTLLSQGLYLEAAEAFMKITEMNSWLESFISNLNF